MDRERAIREIAHRLWEGEGRPAGRELEYYYRAEGIWAQSRMTDAPPGDVSRRTRWRRKRAAAAYHAKQHRLRSRASS